MQRSESIAVVQTGGCSAVINSTLAGIVQAAQEKGLHVIGLENAFEGLFAHREVDLSYLDEDDIAKLRQTPGMFLGSSRLLLTPEMFRDIPRGLKSLGVSCLLMIGGNGTMYAADRIQSSAREQGMGLRVIGVPKTVDNDILGVEFAPGFPSAARYVAQAVKDFSVDLESMKTFEQVRIIEVMGRSAGWLTGAAALAQHGSDTPPHLIYLPEVSFNQEAFLQEVKKCQQRYGYVVAVVGEGIHDEHGQPIGAIPFADIKQASQIYGGASAYLASLVQKRLGLKARAQDLTMAQRCFVPLRSAWDERQAFAYGEAAVQALVQGSSGVMVMECKSDGGFVLQALSRAGGKEKKVPVSLYDQKNHQMSKKFVDWLRPVVEPWSYEYLSLQDICSGKQAKAL